MAEKPLFCLGEAWLELSADTAPELAEAFRVHVGGWAAEFCLAYAAQGGHGARVAALDDGVEAL